MYLFHNRVNKLTSEDSKYLKLEKVAGSAKYKQSKTAGDRDVL